MKTQLALPALFVLALTVPTAQAGPILNLQPSANLYTQSSGIVGWGFSLSFDGLDPAIGAPCALPSPTCWMVVTAADFSAADANNPFTDYIAQYNYIALGPGGSVSQTFDSNAHTGLGSVDLSSPPDPALIGVITVFYDVYDSDPSLGTATQLGFSEALTLNASVSIPEPATWLPAAFALAAMGILRMRRLRR